MDCSSGTKETCWLGSIDSSGNIGKKAMKGMACRIGTSIQ